MQQHRHLQATGLPPGRDPFHLDFWWKRYMTAAFLLLKGGESGDKRYYVSKRYLLVCSSSSGGRSPEGCWIDLRRRNEASCLRGRWLPVLTDRPATMVAFLYLV